jgi:pimeloyl-ACP methyl ester carboxylesterase
MEHSQTELRRRLLSTLPVRERRLSLDGAATAVLEGGNGPPVVLLHGPAAHAAGWLRVIPGLATQWRVVAPDFPGHGASEPLADAADAGSVIDWLADLIRHSCSMPPVLIGHTLGGAVAARFASEHGEELSGLVLIDTLGLQPFRPDPDFGAAVEAFLSAPAEESLDHLWTLCAFDVAALASEMGDLWRVFNAYTLDRARSPALLAAQLRFFAWFGMPAIPAATLARIATATTLVWGRHDRATPLAVAEAASQRFGWPLHVIDGAGDDPSMERPGDSLRILQPLLAALFQRETLR